jgi:hypothetical protein
VIGASIFPGFDNDKPIISNSAPTIVIQISGRRCSGVSGKVSGVAPRGTGLRGMTVHRSAGVLVIIYGPIPASDSAGGSRCGIAAGPMACGLWDTPVSP